MQIQCEQPEKNAIQSYQTDGVMIDQKLYQSTLLVTPTAVIELPEQSDLTDIHATLTPTLKKFNIEILIIGYTGSTQWMPAAPYTAFTKAKIGVEYMKLDAACRTFNILLGEYRKVALLLLFPSPPDHP